MRLTKINNTMKKNYFYFILIPFVSFGQIYSESFEGAALYSTSVAEFNNGDQQYFAKTNGSDIGGSMEYTGKDGTYFFAASESGNRTLTTDDINITGYTEITFAVDIAEDDDGSNQDWDDDDYLHITYSIDSGSDVNLIWVEGDGSAGGIWNHEPAIDAGFDGVGEGDKITSTFSEFSDNITLSSNSTISFKFEFNFGNGDEDVAIDKITVTDATLGGLSDNNIKGFAMYPNPVTNGEVRLTSQRNAIKQVEIYSMLGKQVFNKTVKPNETINVSNLNAGMYMMRVVEEGKIATRKLVIK